MKKTYVLIPLLVICLSASFLIFNVGFYESNMPLYDSYSAEVSNLLWFFRSGTLDEAPYSTEEVIHLYDVREIVQGLIFLTAFLGLFVSLFLVRESRKSLKKNLVVGGSLGLASAMVLPLLAINFDANFIRFHEIFFRNDYWLLPADSTLILMFPQSFFVAAFVRILIYSFVFSIVFIIIGALLPGDEKNVRTKK